MVRLFHFCLVIVGGLAFVGCGNSFRPASPATLADDGGQKCLQLAVAALTVSVLVPGSAGAFTPDGISLRVENLSTGDTRTWEWKGSTSLDMRFNADSGELTVTVYDASRTRYSIAASTPAGASVSVTRYVEGDECYPLTEAVALSLRF